MRSLNNIGFGRAIYIMRIADRLTAQDRRQHINVARAVIFARFQEYIRLKSDLFPISASPFVDPTKEALQYCYKTKTGEVDAIKAEIRLRQSDEYGTLCQYCGIDSPEQFDHYLPKEDFPEFSVFPINLIPCCAKCNGKKSTIWKAARGRKIVNLYFDHIPQEPYLHAAIHLRANGAAYATFSLVFHEKIEVDVRNLIENHFEQLELLARYKKASGRFIAHAKRSFAYHLRRYKASDADIASKLREMAAAERSLYGNNYWLAALYEALANQPGLMR